MADANRKKVALVLREVSDHLRGNLHGILDFVQRSGAWEVHTEGALPHLAWDKLGSWQGDGLIAAIDSEEELQRVLKKKLPTVNVSSRLSQLPVPTVVSDNHAIGRVAAEHLLGMGLKELAFVGPMDLQHNHERLAGFAERVEQAGLKAQVLKLRYVRRNLKIDKQSVVDTSHLGKQLVRIPQPAGVFAPHDDIGCWLLKACRENLLDVPSQIAVLGVDNFELLCGLSCPPLSSVAQSSFQIGFEAARLLDQIMAGEEPACTTRLIQPYGVVARQSTDILAVQDEEVAETLRYIRTQDGQLSVADVFRHLSISRRSMEIRFKDAMGHSIEQELINARIARAKYLLSQTSMPITQVALAVGYQSPTGFSTAFRKEVGMPPREYRSQVSAPQRVVVPSTNSMD